MTETSTELTLSAGEAARTELSRIMNDPGHSMHEGFKRNDAQVNAYIDGLYKKAYGSAPAVFDQGITITSSLSTPSQSNATLSQSTDPQALTPEARMAAMELDATLQRTFGEQYSSEMRDMRMGASYLFASPDGVKLLDHISPVISELGSHAEVASIRYLAELGRISQTPRGGSR